MIPVAGCRLGVSLLFESNTGFSGRACLGWAGLVIACFLSLLSLPALAADWPMLGRTPGRNAISPEENLPTHFPLDVEGDVVEEASQPGLRWIAPIGDNRAGALVVVGRELWAGLTLRDEEGDTSALRCYDTRTGQIRYEYRSPRLPDRRQDYTLRAWGSTPTIEGDRLWSLSNRAELICWDLGPLRRGEGEPLIEWTFDLRAETSKDSHKLVCLDLSRRGDISPRRVVDADGNALNLPHLTSEAIASGARLVDNPNSGVVWQRATDHRNDAWPGMMGCPVVAGGLLVAATQNGWLHALDAQTGDRFWPYNLLDGMLGTPLIADGMIYAATGGGELFVFGLSPDKEHALPGGEPLFHGYFKAAIHGSPIAANGTLYVPTRNRLLAFSPDESSKLSAEQRFAWPEWRGPERDNRSPETGFASWQDEPQVRIRWQAAGLGMGIAAVAVDSAQLITTVNEREEEFATAIDPENGQHLWTTALGPSVFHSYLMRWLSQRVPTLDDQHAFLLTSGGKLVCLDRAIGEIVWERDYAEDFGGIKGWWGWCDFPLLDGDELIVAPGGQDGAVLGLDKATGEILWKVAAPWETAHGYAAPLRAELAGRPQYLVFLQKALIGIDAKTHELLWQYEGLAADQNSMTPLVYQDDLIVVGGHRRNEIARLGFELDAENPPHIQVQQRWRVASEVNHFQDQALIHEGHLFLSERYKLACYELETGKLQWRERLESQRTRQSGRLAMTYAQDHLYVLDATGMLYQVPCDPAACRPSAPLQLDIAEPSRSGTTMPTLAEGQMFVRFDDQLFCLELARATQSTKEAVAEQPTPPAIQYSSPSERASQVIDSRLRSSVRQRSPFVPTPHEVVDAMLDLADVKCDDIVYDLGSGDGRIPLRAAERFSSRGVGIEIEQALVETARQQAEQRDLDELVEFQQEDLFTADFSDATVIMTYLHSPHLHELLPAFRRLPDGVRIVSHEFRIPGIKPKKTIRIRSKSEGADHEVHLWTTPLPELKADSDSDSEEP